MNGKYYVGIDLGGTFVKGGIVDGEGNILYSAKVPTEREKGTECVIQNISNLVLSVIKESGVDKKDVVGVGAGIPGSIDGKNGVAVYSNNLRFRKVPIASAISEKTGLPVKIANDANVATLGEFKFGCGKKYNDVVMLTLGTGVGGGAVIDGKLFEGNLSQGTELGHMIIVDGGEKCTCGNLGCLEAYASATALIRDTKRAMTAHKDSLMNEIPVDEVNGKTCFDYMDKDVYAKEVVDNYIEKLGVGLTNYANIFRPQAIILGGGVSEQGDVLVKPLQKFVDEHIFAGEHGPRVEILSATLKNKAGILGAAALIMK